MAGRGQEGFLKRQRERMKQMEQVAKNLKRRDKSARKKEAKESGAAPQPEQRAYDPFAGH